MKVEVYWNQPIPLRSGRHENLIYTVPDLSSLPVTADVYVFDRLNRDGLIPLHIGQAGRFRTRIRTQLNNARLMLGIANSPGRRRVLLLGELMARPGQGLDATLTLVERTLIQSATLDGYELLNQQGTRPSKHVISFSGSRVGRSWHRRELTVVRPRRGRA